MADHTNDLPHYIAEPPDYQPRRTNLPLPPSVNEGFSTSTFYYPSHVITYIRQEHMANQDHYNDPPYDTVEPPGYQSWRTKLSHNFSEAVSTANGIDNDKFKFWNNTEVRILSMLQQAPEIWHEVIFGWDLDGGVWILDPTPKVDSDMSIYVKLHTLLREQFMHWNQALAECGAKYYKNWRDSQYGRAAVAAHAEPWGYSRPYFMTKEGMESALRGIRNWDRVAKDTHAKLT